MFEIYKEKIKSLKNDITEMNDFIELISFDESLTSKEYEELYALAISYFQM